MDIEDENKAILELAYKAYWDEYREQNENWKALEAKAQGLITSSGIFMAGAFAFSRETSLSLIVIIGTVTTLILLCSSMWFALKTMKAQEFQMLVDGGQSIDLGNTGLMHRTELAKPPGVRLKKMYEHLFDEHRLVLETLENIVQSKATQLRYAYNCLFAASVVALVTSTIHIVKNKQDSKQHAVRHYNTPSSGTCLNTQDSDKFFVSRDHHLCNERSTMTS